MKRLLRREQTKRRQEAKDMEVLMPREDLETTIKVKMLLRKNLR